MNNDEIECFVYRDGLKIYVLKNSKLDLPNKNIMINMRNIPYEDPKIKIIGNLFYFKNKLIHREYGPAIEWNDGYKRWFINGKEYTEEEFNNYIEKKKLKEDLSLNLIKIDDNKTKLKI